MLEEKKSFHIICTDETKFLVDVLHANTQLSKQKIKLALKNGAVWLKDNTGVRRVRKAKKCLKEKDEIYLYYSKKILTTNPKNPTLITDNKNYSIWIKPYGMYCQGSKWGDHFTINRWVENHLQRPTFIVHRLDRATSGLIILAHTKTTARYFANLFAKHEVEKHYRAFVEGEYPEQQQTIDNKVHNKTALSIINRIHFDPLKNQSLINVEIKTGRKHQIRIHLSKQGFPIIGDRLYGNSHPSLDLQLCCYSLAFICPTEKTITRFTNPQCLVYDNS